MEVNVTCWRFLKITLLMYLSHRINSIVFQTLGQDRMTTFECLKNFLFYRIDFYRKIFIRWFRKSLLKLPCVSGLQMFLFIFVVM